MAGVAAHPQEAMFQAAAAQVVLELLLHIVRQRTLLLGHMGDERRVVLLDDPIEECSLGPVRRIRLARFPVTKTLESFQWTWPRKINRLQVQNLFRLRFIEEKANVIFLGGVGLGKTHLATALAYATCQKGHAVLFTTAVDVINTLASAQSAGRLKPALSRYLKPAVLILDELGYLPIDKTGADLLFQIISQRYERGSIVVTSNRVFKRWSEIFNNDSTLTSALLDRLLHHAETVLIEGKSYRMKDQIES
jgi:DNA replication protein DnaC